MEGNRSLRYCETAEVGTQPFGTVEVETEVLNQLIGCVC